MAGANAFEFVKEVGWLLRAAFAEPADEAIVLFTVHTEAPLCTQAQQVEGTPKAELASGERAHRVGKDRHAIGDECLILIARFQAGHCLEGGRWAPNSARVSVRVPGGVSKIRRELVVAGAPGEHFGEGVLLEGAEQAVTAEAGGGEGGTGQTAQESGLLARLAKGGWVSRA